jgi:hypothetical protein
MSIRNLHSRPFVQEDEGRPTWEKLVQAIKWVLVAGGLALLIAGCSSSGPASGPPINTGPTPTAVAVPPSTVLDGTKPVTVPFTADAGALVVTAGPPPGDVTHDRAVTRVQELRRTARADDPSIVAVVSGLVTLRAGLSADSVINRPAWIVIYTQNLMAACPAIATEPQVPSWASNLRAVVILGEQPLPANDGTGTISPIFGYNGAGPGLCYRQVTPTVVALDGLIRGEY